LTAWKAMLLSLCFHRFTRAPQILLERPLAAAAGLTRKHQIEARHEGDVLSAGAGFGAGVHRNARAAATAFAGETRGQLPAMRKTLRVQFPAHFRSFHG